MILDHLFTLQKKTLTIFSREYRRNGKQLTPRSLPMLRTISSTNPLVFMRTPNVIAFRVPTLDAFAAKKVPVIFPAQATVMTSTKRPPDLAP